MSLACVPFDLFVDIMRAALSGRRGRDQPGERYVVFSLDDEAGPQALTVLLSAARIEVTAGRSAPAGADVALVRGPLEAAAGYLLEGNRAALARLSLYGHADALVELGEALRQRQSPLGLRMSQP